MHVIFLTGGLASGKSTVAELLAERGAVVLDADLIAKEAQESESVKSELQAAFGDDILDASGAVKHSLLAERAFASAEATQQLNDICWPPTIKWIEEYIVQGKADPAHQGTLLVVQIPLLAEAPMLIPLADEVITVSAAPEIRLQRAVDRGMDEEDAKRRIARQVSDAEREQFADTVFDNSGDMEALREVVHAWHEKLLQAGAGLTYQDPTAPTV